MKYEIECNHLLDDSLLTPDRLYDGCYNKFLFDENNIFRYLDIGYFGESIDRYYVVCPNCGHVIWLDNNIFSDEVKKDVNGTEENNHRLYKKNLLVSEMIYMEYEDRLSEEEKLVKIRKRQ